MLVHTLKNNAALSTSAQGQAWSSCVGQGYGCEGIGPWAAWSREWQLCPQQGWTLRSLPIDVICGTVKPPRVSRCETSQCLKDMSSELWGRFSAHYFNLVNPKLGRKKSLISLRLLNFNYRNYNEITRKKTNRPFSKHVKGWPKSLLFFFFSPPM